MYCDPKTGKNLIEMKNSDANISSSAIVGEDLEHLFITSAGKGFKDPVERRVFIAKPVPYRTPAQIYEGI